VVDLEAGTLGEVENAARFTGSAVRDLRRVDQQLSDFLSFLDDEGNFEGLHGGFRYNFRDVRVLACHIVSSPWISAREKIRVPFRGGMPLEILIAEQWNGSR
jgi:hypothetical protein